MTDQPVPPAPNHEEIVFRRWVGEQMVAQNQHLEAIRKSVAMIAFVVVVAVVLGVLVGVSIALEGSN